MISYRRRVTYKSMKGTQKKTLRVGERSRELLPQVLVQVSLEKVWLSPILWVSLGQRLSTFTEQKISYQSPVKWMLVDGKNTRIEVSHLPVIFA